MSNPADTEAHADWLTERPAPEVPDADPSPYDWPTCTDGSCYHAARDMPCPEDPWQPTPPAPRPETTTHAAPPF